jgi:hypothetical protein
MRLGSVFTAAAMTLLLLGLRPFVARAAEPTTLECLGAHEESLALQRKHQLRLAREKLVLCSSSSCPAEVRAECMQNVQELNPRLPTIVFEASDLDGRDLVAVTVRMDGELLTERLEGTAVAVDPGEHAFTFQAVGRPTIERKIIIHEGEQDRRERVAWELPAPPKPVAPVVAPSAAVDLERAAPAPAAGRRLGPARIAGLAVGAAGVVALGVGAVYGLEAWSKRDSAKKVCPDRTCTGDNAQANAGQWNAAYSDGNKSTIFFVGGAVGVAAGAALWILGRPHDTAAASTEIKVGPGEVALSGSW